MTGSHSNEADPARADLILQSIYVDAYKAFGEPTQLHVAPITVVLGKNSTGKSALVRSVLFAAQTLRAKERPFALTIDGLAYGSTLTDLTFEQVKTGFTVGFGWTDGLYWTITARADSQPPFQQIIVYAHLQQGDVQRFELRNHDWLEIRARLSEDRRLEAWARRVQHLGDVRRVEDRTRELFDATRVGMDGRHTGVVLAADKEHLTRVNEWFAEHLPPIQVVVEHREGEVRMAVAPPGGAPVPLSQVGAGVAQVLPVVTTLTSELSAADTIVIEHPELHLHPYAHAGVGELLVAAARLPAPPRVIVESHSDLLIWRLRRAVAERRLTPDQVAIWYVDDGAIKRIALDDRGTPDWWPSEVFGELHREVEAIRSALAGRDRA